MRRTTSAFYFGVTLQHTTDSHSFEMVKNAWENSGFSNINVRDSPSTRRDFFYFSNINYLNLFIAVPSKLACRASFVFSDI